jgi:hypothetical protein
MKILILSLSVMLNIQPAATTPQEVVTWHPNLHQLVVVKASTLMPEGMQTQILRHRKQILAGCLDVLRDGYSPGSGEQELLDGYRLLKRYLGSKTPFSTICYQMGRVAALMNELDNPLRAATDGHARTSFRNFLLSEASSFPLVINREGEGFLDENDFSGYLRYRALRNAGRIIRLQAVLVSPVDLAEWKDQRSQAYGLAAVSYNDMVVDVARMWLLAWEGSGGSIAGAPYFGGRAGK